MTIYFDNASTAHPKPKRLHDEIGYYLNEIGVSPGRGGYSASLRATEYVNQLRYQISKLFTLSTPSNIAFTNNATHSLNIITKGFLNAGDHALICSNSHNAVIRPLELLKKEKQIGYDFFSVNSLGEIDFSELNDKITPKTRLIICNHASNVFGIITKIVDLADFCKKNNLALLLDVTQTAGIIPLDAGQLGIDFLAGTGHKTLQGPSGIGFLYVKNPELVSSMIEGGSDGNSSASVIHPQMMPCKFEAGTLNYLGIAGLIGSLQELLNISFEKIRKDDLKLTEYAWDKMKSIPSVTLYGTDDFSLKVPIISLNMNQTSPAFVASILDKKFRIHTRAGLQCSPLSHKQMGTYPSGTLRLSFKHTNTYDEIDYFIESLKSINEEIYC